LIAHLNHQLKIIIKKKQKYSKIKNKIKKYSNRIFKHMEEIIFQVILTANYNNKLKNYKSIKNDYLL
jgi:hypothetical protein